MKLTTPRTLSFKSRTINFTGMGRSTGSYAYFDVVSGQTYELFVVRVHTVESSRVLGHAIENRALPNVSISFQKLVYAKSPAQVGTLLLAGPVKLKDGAFCALGAWKLKTHHPTNTFQPKKRNRGFITSVARCGSYGWIRNGDSDLFVHQDELRNVPLAIGVQVSFEKADHGRGPKAINVRAA